VSCDGHERLAQVVGGDVGEALGLGVRAAAPASSLAGRRCRGRRRSADDGTAASRNGDMVTLRRAGCRLAPLRLDALDALTNTRPKRVF
jgi:hypothetical protein